MTCQNSNMARAMILCGLTLKSKWEVRGSSTETGAAEYHEPEQGVFREPRRGIIFF